MKTLYLMRHGETLFNQQKKIQGWCDSTLTELGRKQAAIAKDYLLKMRSNWIVLMLPPQKEPVIL